ncbi:hypothetical protein NONI108955_10030 [Nocardia ninae]|uniref:PatG C-terminal domain-containing protein n=1 Tax=Nocardia ninae NBRC 108245 TaxID=1210091 RepID=A0A511M9D5_9NOCA|nr:hypothetical protein [Nocardia ninae]GEM36827.1 hypothetical protein NN4_13460 [Nocardia ninae NBRC 108245]
MDTAPATAELDSPADTHLDRIEPAHTPHEVPCPTCSGQTAALRLSDVYAIGRIEARFPSLAVEKEFAQSIGRAVTDGQTDRETFATVLSDPDNRYLARALCWVLTIRELETYIVLPRDPSDLDRLIEALRPRPSPGDLDVVIGTRGPLAAPAMCNGLVVPVVHFDQLYSFDRAELMGALPRSEGVGDDQFTAAAELVLDRILHIADNAGATDEHRALNYLAMRYSEIYRRTATQFEANFSLTGVDVRPSSLGGGRSIVDCIFSYTDRRTSFTEKYFVAVDVTERFPFLIGSLGPYYDRTSTY